MYFFTFSKPSSDRKAHFNAHEVDIPSPGETRWYYKSRAVKAIIEGFNEIKIALSEITNNPQDWSDETVAKADGLLQSLGSFRFCFLLELYWHGLVVPLREGVSKSSTINLSILKLLTTLLV